jgi:hypothetical protein
MLPGFRFLFAAIVLSLSVLVFGLGAAALLRAAHEEFASMPSWHAPPETVFAQPGDTTRPVLAMMRVDAPGAEKPSPVVEKPSLIEKPLDNAPALSAPAESPAPPAEPEKIAALKVEEPPPPQIAKPELPAAEPSAPGAETPVQAETAAASAEEIKTAATEQATPPATDAAPAAPEPVSIQASPAADDLLTKKKIATLGGPAVTVELPAAKAASEKPHDDAIKKRQQARRTAQRHRRARVAAQTLQPAADPFSQPTITVRKR